MRKKKPDARVYVRRGMSGYIEKPQEKRPCSDCGSDMRTYSQKKSPRLTGVIWRFKCNRCYHARNKVLHPDLPDLDRGRQLMKKYKLTTSEYDVMFASQGGVCAICKKSETVINPRTGKPKRLSVDHNHETKAVRRLLCNRCNLKLGRVEKPAVASDAEQNYLNEYSSLHATLHTVQTGY